MEDCAGVTLGVTRVVWLGVCWGFATGLFICVLTWSWLQNEIGVRLGMFQSGCAFATGRRDLHGRHWLEQVHAQLQHRRNGEGCRRRLVLISSNAMSCSQKARGASCACDCACASRPNGHLAGVAGREFPWTSSSTRIEGNDPRQAEQLVSTAVAAQDAACANEDTLLGFNLHFGKHTCTGQRM